MSSVCLLWAVHPGFSLFAQAPDASSSGNEATAPVHEAVPAPSSAQDVTDSATSPDRLVRSRRSDPTTPPKAAATAGTQTKPLVPLQPPPAGFDIQARSRQVLAHLSAVIRFYRGTLPAVQKVGEPSDLLYREQGLADTERIAQLAFQAGRAEAVLLQAYAKQTGLPDGGPAEGEAQRLQTFRGTLINRIQSLKAQQKAVDAQMQHARRNQVAALQEQKEELDGQLDLNPAILDSLSRMVSVSETQGRGGLAGDIERLQRTAPELASPNQKPVATPPLENLDAARSPGVTGQATVVFQLLGTRRALDAQVRELDRLRDEARDLREPLVGIARQLVKTGQELAQQTPDPVPVAPQNGKAATTPIAASSSSWVAQERHTYESLTATFKVLSEATVPLSQEVITLEQARANVLTWRAAVDAEYTTVLRALLLRVLAIAIALALVFAVGEIWRRGTVRYVHDIRRRRQLLVLRRVVVGFLSGLVVIFGVVSQFNSLATFAGFITAGLAVGLQTILLSVAAYFFIVGRYGVRVGDRITIAGVTGDVVDVGLVRLYMMELGGGGNELHPTGRIAVFPNSVLFQAATPLYKQMPGTEYSWRELTVKLSGGANYSAVCERVLRAIHSVFDGYRARIESQHRAVEAWMDAALDPRRSPRVCSSSMGDYSSGCVFQWICGIRQRLTSR